MSTTMTSVRPLRLGTRASALALAQSGAVGDALAERLGRPVELVHITTDGDRSHAPITQLGGTGVFVSALRDALLADRIDLAVHSYKDLPTAPADGLRIAAVPVREDPRDALVSRDGVPLDKLPPGARVGTGAPRRIAQLLAHRPDLVCVPIRGNVDTRLKRITDDLDAVVLAVAGLARLGRAAEITEPIDPSVVLPAPAQGALAIECRADDPQLIAALALLDDPATHAAVLAERSLLAALEAGCSAPVGAHAVIADGLLTLTATVTAPDGRAALRDVRSVATGNLLDMHTDAERLGRRLAADLLAGGADTLMGRTE
jgi:hydroxymethylbilane synthase